MGRVGLRALRTSDNCCGFKLLITLHKNDTSIGITLKCGSKIMFCHAIICLMQSLAITSHKKLWEKNISDMDYIMINLVWIHQQNHCYIHQYFFLPEVHMINKLRNNTSPYVITDVSWNVNLLLIFKMVKWYRMVINYF